MLLSAGTPGCVRASRIDVQLQAFSVVRGGDEWKERGQVGCGWAEKRKYFGFDSCAFGFEAFRSSVVCSAEGFREIVFRSSFGSHLRPHISLSLSLSLSLSSLEVCFPPPSVNVHANECQY